MKFLLLYELISVIQIINSLINLVNYFKNTLLNDYFFELNLLIRIFSWNNKLSNDQFRLLISNKRLFKFK